MFGAVVKTLFETPVSYMSVPGFQSWLYFQLQSPAKIYTGKQQVMAQVLGSLSSTWEVQIESRAWLQSGQAVAIIDIWGVNQQVEDCVYVCVCSCVYVSVRARVHMLFQHSENKQVRIKR